MIWAPQQTIVARAQVKIREHQRRQKEGVDANKQASSRPDRTDVRAHLIFALFGSVARLARLIESVSHCVVSLALGQ